MGVVLPLPSWFLPQMAVIVGAEPIEQPNFPLAHVGWLWNSRDRETRFITSKYGRIAYRCLVWTVAEGCSVWTSDQ